MAPVKTNPDVKQDFIYGPSHKLSNSNGKTIGPNKETILVTGDIKHPIRYDMIWHDYQKKMPRHDTCKLCRRHKRYSHYKGIAHKPICPHGYTSMGDIYTSQLNLPDELKDKVNSKKGFVPINQYQPVCIPNDCVENIKTTYNRDSMIVWDTYRSNRPAFGAGASNWYKYTIENAQIFSLSPTTNTKSDYEATNENAYNLSKLQLKSKDIDKYNNSIAVSSNTDAVDIEEIVTGIITRSVRKKNKIKSNMKFRPDFFSIKESCIIHEDDERRNINLGGDDYQWPSILKEDKTGKKEDEESSLFTSDTSNKLERDTKIIILPEYLNEKAKELITRLQHLQENLNSKKNKDKTIDFAQFDYEKIDEYGLVNTIIFDILGSDDIEFTNEDINLFHIITEYIGFLSSLPITSKYSELHTQNKEIHKKFNDIVAPINDERLNGLKNKLGLGWKDIPRFDNKGKDYSMHHFLYIEDEGHIKLGDGDSSTLKFTKVTHDSYTLQFKNKNNIGNYNNYYLKVEPNNTIKRIITIPSINNESYHFKLRLTGNMQNEIKIMPQHPEHTTQLLSYESTLLGSNTDKFTLIENNLKANRNKTVLYTIL